MIHSGLCDKPRENVKKQRHHFADKGLSSQSCSFSSSHVRMWELDCKEGWVQKNRCFETVVLEKTLENPLDCREINQSILKEISPEYSLEGLMLKMKLQYFGHLTWRVDSLEKTLMLGKIEGRRRGWQRMRWLDGTTDSMDMGLDGLWELELGDGQGGLACCGSWGHKELDMTEGLSWTELKQISTPLLKLTPYVNLYPFYSNSSPPTYTYTLLHNKWHCHL